MSAHLLLLLSLLGLISCNHTHALLLHVVDLLALLLLHHHHLLARCLLLLLLHDLKRDKMKINTGELNFRF